MIVTLLAIVTTIAQNPLYRIEAVTRSTFDPETQVREVVLRNPQKVFPYKGGLFILDSGRFRVLHVLPSGAVRIVGGTGDEAGAGSQYREGQLASESALPQCSDLVVDRDENLFLACPFRGVLKIDPTGKLSRITAGISDNAGKAPQSGDPAISARLNPLKLSMDPQNRLLIGEANRIVRVESNSAITVIAGTGGYDSRVSPRSGNATSVDISLNSFTCDSAGTIYFVGLSAAQSFWSIGQIDGAGLLSYKRVPSPTFIGAVLTSVTWNSSTNGLLFVAQMQNGRRIYTYDPITGSVTVSTELSPDRLCNSILCVSLTGEHIIVPEPGGSILLVNNVTNRISRLTSGRETQLIGRDYSFPLQLRTGEASTLELPIASKLFGGSNGKLYVVMPSIGQFLAIDNAGNFTAENGARNGVTGASASDGRLFALGADGAYQYNPNRILGRIDGTDIAFDDTRNTLYVSDGLLVRAMNLGETSLVGRTIAGSDNPGFSGDGGPAIRASFRGIGGIAVDRSGRIYLADTLNNRIRRIGLDGVVTTFAGNGTTGKPSDNAPILSSPINSPGALAFGPTGNLLVAEGNSRVVREIDMASGTIRIIAGNPDNPPGSSGDGGSAATARFHYIAGLAYGPQGQVYILESYQGRSRIRVLTRAALNFFDIFSGNNQSALAGTKLPQPLQVRAVANNRPFSGLEVRFSGPAQFDPLVALTNGDGIASTSVTLGDITGPISLIATNPILGPLTFRANVTPNVRPTIRSAAGAGAFGAVSTVSSGMWVEVFGISLSSTTRSWEGNDFTRDRGPTVLNGVSVSVANRPAFVAYISPSQLNVQLPDDLPTGQAELIVTNELGSSLPFRLNIVSTAPSILAPAVFAPYAAALLSDGSFVGPVNYIPGVAFRPAKPGEAITLFGIGMGPTNPRVLAGHVTPGIASLNTFDVSIGGKVAQVTYAGLSPSLVGLYQINLIVPQVDSGDLPIAISANGAEVKQRLLLAVE